MVPVTAAGNPNAEIWVPEKYQEKGVEFLVSRLGAGLFAKPGLGKTSMSLAALKVLFDQSLIDRVIICAPLLVCYNVWPGEINKWSNFNHLTYSIVHGKKEKALATDVQIYLVNHEGLEWLHDNWPKHWKTSRMVFLADESTRFKNHDTLRFRILRGGRITRTDEQGNPVRKKFDRLLDYFKWRWILTGTPLSKRYMDLWSQIYLLDDGLRLGNFISHYRSDYFTFDPYSHDYFLNVGAKEKIQELIHDTVLFIDDEENIELPTLVGDVAGLSSKTTDKNRARGIQYIDLPDKARKSYNEMEELFITQLQTGTVKAVNAAVASSKLRQIANGGVYLQCPDDVAENYLKSAQKKFEQVHYQKAEAVKSIVEEMSGDPVLIAYEYHHDLARLKKVLGKKTPHIGHGVTVKETNKILEAWNAGGLESLLVQPQSVSFGLNMQHGGRAIVWHSIPWSYENYYQLVKRLWRRGQKDRVFLYHLVSRGTVDEAVLANLCLGADTERDFLQALKKYYGQ